MSLVKINFLVVPFLLLSSGLIAQSSLVGTWQNTQEQVKLILNADLSGSYTGNGKAFDFESSYTLKSVGDDSHLEFKIKTGTETKTMYAILRKINAAKIRFIIFLSTESIEMATDEIIESGIVLTKE